METKITQHDIQKIKTQRDNAIEMIKHYAAQYKSKEHYEHLGASCVMSATGTVDTVIGSAQNLDGMFIMPDEIHVERLVDWFVENRDYNCDRAIVTYYFASYIKRKVNSLYRSINKNAWETTFTIWGNKKSINKFKEECIKRRSEGVKIIRI